MDSPPLDAVFDNYDLVLAILSFLTPTDCDEARELASGLCHVSQRIQKLLFLQLLSMPLRLTYEDMTQDYTTDYQVAQFVKRHGLKVTDLQALVRATHVRLFNDAYAGIDFSQLKILQLSVIWMYHDFDERDLPEFFSLFAQAAQLEELELVDDSQTENYRSLLGLKNLERVKLVSYNLGADLSDIEDLPHLKHLCLTPHPHGFPTTGIAVKSSSLRVLDVVDVFDTPIVKQDCPTLQTIVCRHRLAFAIGEVQSSTLLERSVRLRTVLATPFETMISRPISRKQRRYQHCLSVTQSSLMRFVWAQIVTLLS